MTTISSSEYRSMGDASKNKFGAKRTVVDGITFASKREAAYYCELKLREKAGEVSDVEMQRPFALVAGVGHLVGTYRADFTFQDHVSGCWRVIDVKGHDTALSRFKRKFVEALHGVKVEVVR